MFIPGPNFNEPWWGHWNNSAKPTPQPPKPAEPEIIGIAWRAAVVSLAPNLVTTVYIPVPVYAQTTPAPDPKKPYEPTQKDIETWEWVRRSLNKRGVEGVRPDEVMEGGVQIDEQ